SSMPPSSGWTIPAAIPSSAPPACATASRAERRAWRRGAWPRACAAARTRPLTPAPVRWANSWTTSCSASAGCADSPSPSRAAALRRGDLGSGRALRRVRTDLLLGAATDAEDGFRDAALIEEAEERAVRIDHRQGADARGDEALGGHPEVVGGTDDDEGLHDVAGDGPVEDVGLVGEQAQGLG